MAPTKPKGNAAKGAGKSGGKSAPSSSSSKSKKLNSNPRTSTKPTTKTKPITAKEKYFKKRHSYSEKSLDLPKLNTITPAGVQKIKGKKKGKIFVDDQDSMMTLLAMVNAEKEGQIESKMAKARQMEEIRQARQQEMDKRKEEKKSKLVSSLCIIRRLCSSNIMQEDTKDSLRRPNSKKAPPRAESRSLGPTAPNVPKKRVSFG